MEKIEQSGNGKHTGAGMLLTLTLLILAAFFVNGARQAEAADGRIFCVVDELLPIMEAPGGTYEVAEYDIWGDGIQGLVVYGNHIRVNPVSDDRFRDSWVELPDPENGSVLGYIETKGLMPRPEMETFEARPYLVRAGSPDILLYPGSDEKYRLSGYNFSLGKGEVVAAFGSCKAGGSEWLMLGFGTSVEDDGESGIGMRYAWAMSGDLLPLQDYKPDHTKADGQWMPSGVRNLSFEPLSENARGGISRHGFWIDPEPIIPNYLMADDMGDRYNDTGEYSVDFITADLFFHAWHLISDRMLEDLELNYFAAALGKCLSGALAELERIKPEYEHSDEAMASYDMARDMFAVPLTLLGGNPGVSLSGKASAEIARILEAAGSDTSELTEAKTDYTQYRPRGHYTTRPEMERYFRAMSFLGDAGLPLFETDGRPRLNNVRTAALITLVFGSLGGTWRSFEEPINFMFGVPDDGGPSACKDVVKRNAGGPGDLADGKKLETLANELKTHFPAPRIRDRETGVISKEEELAARGLEFRISGKRFTFDSYIFNELTSPRVGSDENPRSLPEGTDVMAILGSPAAGEFIKRNGGVPRYSENIKRLKAETKDFMKGQDLYSLRLEMLMDFFKDSGSRQFFYRSPAWQWKKLLTASASWAELKHDSILYAKQGGAEMGSGGFYAGKFAPPSPRGYVEPDPRAFASIIGMAERAATLFKKFSFEGKNQDGEREYSEKLEALIKLCASAQSLAEKEAAGSPLSLEDYYEIKAIARSFGASLLLPGGNDIDDWKQLRMAIVADAATDHLNGLAIYAATGTPRKIYVFVNDASGGPRIARGYIYSYYEFASPLANGRMTDDEWRDMVYDENKRGELLKLHPEWYGSLE
ncbi:MAG: DUF3160 domain-containing protein [Synergistaceae bacterium]|jgi:hypothetical protein|nr:DUF3160 domain-containing protein [Synergistaceae bacterium]